MNSLKIAVAQINVTVGDLARQCAKLLDAGRLRSAFAQGAQLVIAPELALCGYPPEDLLLRPAFMDACHAALDTHWRPIWWVARGCICWSGHPHQFGERGDVRTKSVAVQQRFNAASVLTGGRVLDHLLQTGAAELPGLR